ncbi:MAG TPA: SMC-Scp complex subunit ScpB [Firmicutes bacterium]|jgi:segregation and condensation protein B|nr:SMC-Scp complex subunit ScpB [Bacillota bacterium]HCF91335.1 SMC-Scp complex subunit ScpB [Bacillota bacterium]HCM18519.1 SMC-Scp complex subunit ScpB [Bacillota bacterium]HCT35439.1 SMC-Scp complex subunit ScpB [Bacillota bacterium]
MNLLQARAVIEALIFAAPEPIGVPQLCELTGLTRHTVQQILADLSEDYQKGHRGLQMIEVAKGYQICTHPYCAPYVEKLQKNPRSTGLSQAAMETLAIIAYKQPITRAEIEVLRGVRVDSALNTLLEKDLIREAGRKDTPGRPILYGTTRAFLKYFGLKELSDLPGIDKWLQEEILRERDSDAGAGDSVADDTDVVDDADEHA